MKHLVAFIICLFFNSFETNAIYSLENQATSTNFPIMSTPKKLTYKERVTLKYLKLKAKVTKTNKKTRFLVAATIFLVIAVGLTIAARQSNASVPKNGFTGSNDGCLKGVLALVSYATSLVLFVIAMATSV